MSEISWWKYLQLASGLAVLFSLVLMIKGFQSGALEWIVLLASLTYCYAKVQDW